MKNIIYNISGISMFMWYLGFRWNFLSKEPWLFNPINFITAIASIIFLLPTLISPIGSFNKWFFYIAIFLLFRNFYYTIEDIIDLIHFPSNRQLFYIIMDLIMFNYVYLWIDKYNNWRKKNAAHAHRLFGNA